MGPLSRLRGMRMATWLLLFEAARATHGHVMHVTSAADRRFLNDVVRRTKGRPNKLTERDKAELKRISAQLKPLDLVRDIAMRSMGRKH